ncbi:class I SAM-dependent methyltransferase [Roseateles koreensis]|uniref:Class I SAM-dependent methyltransferase n=1 Tax=Roseateles koreensis TaxID=2987526 RepID=A0ABT5KP74_9BURK|nr:class I SAM-dependent methyltransferase [Roseateles koreensis]MDC8784704.1 class I SAM-dependent methyltransferase [Roseateles koreensis]
MPRLHTTPAKSLGPPSTETLYQFRAGHYDWELQPFEPLRRLAVEHLNLRAGLTVLDLGCGTGLSLPLLREAVGPTGRIIGIEQCPAMLAHARQRVADQGWRNIDLMSTPVAQADLAPDLRADAALFHFTHDILQDPEALRHLSHHLRPGATLVATGLRWAPPWAWATNMWVMAAAFYSVASLQGLDCPWQLLQAQVDDLQIEHHLSDAVYLAWGTLNIHPQPAPRQIGRTGRTENPAA